MKCKYYKQPSKVKGHIDICCIDGLEKEYPLGCCEGDECRCIYPYISIEAKRLRKDQTNREWLNNLNNVELGTFLCSNYFKEIIGCNFLFPDWLDKPSCKEKIYGT